MRNDIGAASSTAAVVQDSLTGEILWVGHLDSQMRSQVTDTGILRLASVSMGQPVPVRHLSSRGDGVVLHVESPATRRQMDSFLPEPPFAADSTELPTESAFASSATWQHTLARIPPAETSSGPDLVECIDAFRDSARKESATGVAERAAAVLGALIDEFADARLPLALVVETLVRTRSV